MNDTTSHHDADAVDFMAAIENAPRAKAERLMARRGHAYGTQGGKYISLAFHSASESDCALIAREFGGAYYSHNSGWQWKCSRTKVVDRVRRIVEYHNPSDKNRRWRVLFLPQNPIDSASSDGDE